MMLVRWMRFKWALRSLPEAPGLPSPHYAIRLATREEIPTATHVMMRSFSLDPSWGDVLKTMQDGLLFQLHTLLTQASDSCLVVTHGSRVIAASALDFTPEALSNLASGPCISMEYRNRGIGSALLHASLCHLRDGGLREGTGLTKHNVASCKYVYPKFGSTSEPVEFRPQVVAAG